MDINYNEREEEKKFPLLPEPSQLMESQVKVTESSFHVIDGSSHHFRMTHQFSRKPNLGQPSYV